MAATITSSGAVIIKAGHGVSSFLSGSGVMSMNADTILNQFINEGESFVNVVTKRNWTDDYSSLNADVKKILDDAVSSYAAISVINYDMSGYTSLAEAQTMMDVNWAKFKECVDVLKEQEAEDFIDQET